MPPPADSGLVGREWLVKIVRAWRADPAGAGWFLLTGPAGSGKTAIVQRLASDPWTHVHFADRRRDGSSTSLRGFTRRLSVTLARSLPGFGAALARSVSPTNVYLHQVIEHNEGAVYGLFAQTLNVRHASVEDLFQDAVVAPLTVWAADHPGERISLLVDGVDETVQRDGRSLATLLAGLPADPAASIFVATRADGEVLKEIDGDVLRVALDEPPHQDRQLADLRAFVEARTDLVLVSLAYSRWLKGTVLLGNAVVAALGSAPILLGGLITGTSLVRVTSAQAMLLTYMFGYEILKSLRDAPGDAAAGYRTVATRWGLRRGLVVWLATVAAFVALSVGCGLAYGLGWAYQVLMTSAVDGTLVVLAIRVWTRRTTIARAVTVCTVIWLPGLLAMGRLG